LLCWEGTRPQTKPLGSAVKDTPTKNFRDKKRQKLQTRHSSGGVAETRSRKEEGIQKPQGTEITGG